VSQPTKEEIKRWLLDAYEYRDGIVVWRRDSTRGIKRGDSVYVGPRSKGYLSVKVNTKPRRSEQLHRVVWLLVHGDWPPGKLDHRDLDKANCRIENLRPATSSQNGANRLSPRARTSPGAKGIYFLRNRWHAGIRHNGKRIHIGVFNDLEAAKSAYDKQAQLLFGEFARCHS
jgi:hypothetical protein